VLRCPLCGGRATYVGIEFLECETPTCQNASGELQRAYFERKHERDHLAEEAFEAGMTPADRGAARATAKWAEAEAEAAAWAAAREAAAAWRTAVNAKLATTATATNAAVTIKFCRRCKEMAMDTICAGICDNCGHFPE